MIAAVILAALVSSAAAQPPGPYAPLLDRTQDRVVRSAFVPNRLLPQGEVRLLRRDGAAVMQTVIDTYFLDRVVAEIRKKEMSSWPPGREGHEDSRKYIDALRDAQARIEERFRDQGSQGGRRRKMLIEFILSDNASIVALSEPELEGRPGNLRIPSARPLVLLELSRGYVRGDFYEIARNALNLGETEAKDLLDPLLPRDSAGIEVPSKNR